MGLLARPRTPRVQRFFLLSGGALLLEQGCPEPPRVAPSTSWAARPQNPNEKNSIRNKPSG